MACVPKAFTFGAKTDFVHNSLQYVPCPSNISKDPVCQRLDWDGETGQVWN